MNLKTDPEKTGLEFINSIKGGNIPKEYIPSVEKGFKDSMQTGVLAGFPVESMKIELVDGSFHAVDSDSLSFELVQKWPTEMLKTMFSYLIGTNHEN